MIDALKQAKAEKKAQEIEDNKEVDHNNHLSQLDSIWVEPK